MTCKHIWIITNGAGRRCLKCQVMEIEDYVPPSKAEIVRAAKEEAALHPHPRCPNCLGAGTRQEVRDASERARTHVCPECGGSGEKKPADFDMGDFPF